MKNTTLISCLLCLFLLPFCVTAQPALSQPQPRFQAGIIAGGNFSQVDGDLDAGVHKVGLNAGFSSYTMLAPNVYLNLELLFSQKGSRYGREWQSYAGPYLMVYQMKLNYIEIPLLLHYEVAPRWVIGAGASYNRLLQSQERYRGLYGWNDFDPEKYPYKKNEWEYVGSASFRLSNKVIAELRYQYSITPVRAAADIPQDFSGYKAQRNNLFALRIGYYL